MKSGSKGTTKPSEDDKIEKSDSSIELEQTETSVKSNANTFDTQKLIPVGFRGKPDPKKETGVCAFLRLDLGAINNCSGYSQFLIIISSLVMIPFLAVLGCRHETETVVTTVGYTLNVSESLPLNEAKDESIINQLVNKKDTHIRCVTNYYFIGILIISLLVQSFSLFAYVYHLVEACPSCPWLVIECIFYTIWTIQYLIMSSWMMTIGGWLLLTASFGFIDSFIYLILAIFKCKHYTSGRPAQETALDPDGNVFRQTSPNYRFKKPDSSEELKIKKSDSL